MYLVLGDYLVPGVFVAYAAFQSLSVGFAVLLTGSFWSPS